MRTAAKTYRSVSLEQTRNDLIVRHIDYVSHILKRQVANLPEGVDKDNLEAAGILGLVEAAQQFDPKRGVPFKTFAFPRIRGAIIDELRRNCPLPQQMLQMIAKVRNAYETIEPPRTPEAIARAAGLSTSQVEECLDAMRLTRLGVWEESAATSARYGQDGDDSPDALVELEELKEVMADSIERLPYQERIVLTLYYMEDLRLKEIGKVVGLSESRVSRILSRAEFRLKEVMRQRTR